MVIYTFSINALNSDMMYYKNKLSKYELFHLALETFTNWSLHLTVGIFRGVSGNRKTMIDRLK